MPNTIIYPDTVMVLQALQGDDFQLQNSFITSSSEEPDLEMRTRRSPGKRAPMSPWRASTGGGRRSGRGRGRRGFGRAGLADAGEEVGGGGGGEDGLGLAKDLLL
ncbi:uncharacterized protein A4U43_C03F25630 [Asparagus officinalis]|uniref:Uncharacterized protein n=1 Tax=Asparagus officinalis TaxID=4686 RepID=A0A5P1FEU1_ASPOF|nr:uncharacterized protein A4U43_C03F25630 [Asparagus officinalis]